jgi:tetratricopeptide (TPR) repeat protein
MQAKNERDAERRSTRIGLVVRIGAFLLLWALNPLFAQEIAFSKGFEHFYNLEYNQALTEFQEAAATAPENPNCYNHIAQTILYREMFRAGALESELVSGSNPFLRRPKMNPSEEDQRQFDDAIGKAMSLAQARIDKDPKDIGALYALGVSYGLRANYNFLVRKAWLDALRDATSARKLHNKVTELDPSFTDARLVQGVHDYVVGSLPFFYKMLGFVAGFRGDKKKGIRTLQLVAQEGDRNRVDAEVLLAAVYRREQEPEEAIPLLEDLIRRFPRNYLLRFEMVQMYSDSGKKDEALAVLREMDKLKQEDAPGYDRLPVEKIYFSRGNLLFWYRDLDGAVDNLKKVTARADELDLNTGVMAWMRLGQTYDLRGQRTLARDAYRQAIQFAPGSEPAKESKRYLSSPYRRPKEKG